MREVLSHFRVEQEDVATEPYGSGHINRTFLVTVKGQRRYILQGINTAVFQDTDALMDNIERVTDYLRGKIMQTGGEPERGTLTIVRTTDDKSYYTDADGKDWRVYLYIENAKTYDTVENETVFYQSALAFGKFQAWLADYPAKTLHETIPDFHNTPKRCLDFEDAVEKDCCGRAKEAESEIAFLRARRKEMSVLQDMQKSGELPLRVTHNDTKLNNIMIDCDTNEAVCIIDLDTVMPGLSVHDFGDAIRFGANTAAEDETDLTKVSLSLPLFDTYVKGFLAGCGGQLTKKEIEMLPMGAKTMTLECGMRFLTDYLQGDTYYKIHHEKHNLERCRCQLALAADMETKWQKMCELCR